MKVKLPDYEPPTKIWDNIDALLDSREIIEVLHSLPQYEPSEKVWKRISSKMNTTKSFFTKWVAAASAIIIGALFYHLDSKEVKYSEIQVATDLMLSDRDINNYGYNEIKKICMQDKIACHKSEFRVLEAELDELNTAAIRLKMAIGKYNTELELTHQLIEIEHKQAEIIDKMASLI